MGHHVPAPVADAFIADWPGIGNYCGSQLYYRSERLAKDAPRFRVKALAQLLGIPVKLAQFPLYQLAKQVMEGHLQIRGCK